MATIVAVHHANCVGLKFLKAFICKVYRYLLFNESNSISLSEDLTVLKLTIRRILRWKRGLLRNWHMRNMANIKSMICVNKDAF
ncbi:unnamed protein product [Meloidogyne enterolobii]|uniref:Uncharacterized protein n=1 Tax=Meloidogyne enterolobii TaxID=390850 RepID=A0ACB0XLX9_MELEN